MKIISHNPSTHSGPPIPPAGNYGAPQAAPAPPAGNYGAPSAAPASNYGVPAADPIDSYTAPRAPDTGYGVPLSEPVGSNSIADYRNAIQCCREIPVSGVSSHNGVLCSVGQFNI